MFIRSQKYYIIVYQININISLEGKLNNSLDTICILLFITPHSSLSMAIKRPVFILRIRVSFLSLRLASQSPEKGIANLKTDASIWKLISSFLDIDFIHCDIRDRPFKKYIIIFELEVNCLFPACYFGAYFPSRNRRYGILASRVLWTSWWWPLSIVQCILAPDNDDKSDATTWKVIFNF